MLKLINLTISILIHILISICFVRLVTSFTEPEGNTAEILLEFNIVNIPKESKEVGIASKNQNNFSKVAARNFGMKDSKSKDLFIEEETDNLNSVMISSLNSLLQIRQKTELSIRTIQNDQEKYFLPNEGKLPDTDFLLDGIKNGFGNGNRTGLAIRFGKKNGKPLCPGFTPIDTTFTIE